MNKRLRYVKTIKIPYVTYDWNPTTVTIDIRETPVFRISFDAPTAERFSIVAVSNQDGTITIERVVS